MPAKRGKTLRDVIARSPDSARSGREEELYFSVGKCSLGPVLVASSGEGVVSIQTGDDADRLLEDLQERFPTAHLVRSGRDGRELLAQVIALIDEPARGFDFPVDMRGTAFQKRVWRAVQSVPAGQTSTYMEVARKIGAPKAARAVGTACAHCILAFVVPCHRILRKGGLTSKDAEGDERRRMLVERETAK